MAGVPDDPNSGDLMLEGNLCMDYHHAKCVAGDWNKASQLWSKA